MLGYFNTISKMLALNKNLGGWDYRLFIAHIHGNDKTNILSFLVVVVVLWVPYGIIEKEKKYIHNTIDSH